MAYTSRAFLNLRIFYIAFIVCNLYAVVSVTAYDTEQGQWCILTESPDTVGTMECKFDEEVHFIQLDYFKTGSLDPPEIAVSCDQSICEPSYKFADMLKVRGSPSKQLLTLTLHGVPTEHAGKYRCQAQSVADSHTEEGVCSLRFPNTDLLPASRENFAENHFTHPVENPSSDDVGRLSSTIESATHAPVPTKEGQWCSLVASPQSVGSMECKFSEEVQFIQVDFYGSDYYEVAVIAVSCDQTSCDPNAKFADMLKVRSLSKQLLTLEVQGVSQAHAGNYRCLAQSIASTLTAEGKCSLRYPIPEITTESPAAKKESDILYYVLLVLLVLQIAATVILLLCICKRKSLGPWKKQDSVGAGPLCKGLNVPPCHAMDNFAFMHSPTHT